jgi:cytochrome c oxidase assembly protein Cox11
MKLVKDFLSLVGAVAVVMFLLGYTYASVPLPKTCTPTLIDWILK